MSSGMGMVERPEARTLTADELAHVEWLHIYGQPYQHQDAEIRGTVDGLRALRDALTAAIEGGTAEVVCVAADGEGYGVQIRRINLIGLLGPLPYTDQSWGWPRHVAWDQPPPVDAALQDVENER